MLQIIKQQLLKMIDDIDCGNSDHSEEELLQIAEAIRQITDKTERLSKYQAAKYIKKSTSQFDEGKIPKGKKQQGFNELS